MKKTYSLSRETIQSVCNLAGGSRTESSVVTEAIARYEAGLSQRVDWRAAISMSIAVAVLGTAAGRDLNAITEEALAQWCAAQSQLHF